MPCTLVWQSPACADRHCQGEADRSSKICNCRVAVVDGSVGLWADLQVMFVWPMLQTIPGDCRQKGGPGGPSDGEYAVSLVTRFNNKESHGEFSQSLVTRFNKESHGQCSQSLVTRFNNKKSHGEYSVFSHQV